MAFTQGDYRLLKTVQLTDTIYSFTIHSPQIASIAKPGQFVHVKAEGFFLRRPISICEIDKENQTIRLVFEIRGEGTQKIAQTEINNTLDLMGPLGNGFPLLEPKKKVLLIGGGIGVPPMVGLSQYYKENATAIIGFQTKEKCILEKDFAAYGSTVLPCTDDGSYGYHGFVTQQMEAYLQNHAVAMVYACGPMPMLKGVVAVANEHQIPCKVSLEERMGCGVGACLVCACKIKKQGEETYLHVCKDGPVFDGNEVVF